MFGVPRMCEIIEAIEIAAIQFWRCVETDTPPEPASFSASVAKRVRRVPKLVIPAPAEIGLRFQAAKIAFDWAESELEAARGALLGAMGTGDGLDCGEGGLFTYLEQVSHRFDSKRFRTEKPEIAAQFMAESRFRVLRQKKARKGE